MGGEGQMAHAGSSPLSQETAVNHRHPVAAAHHATDQEQASPQWWWLPAVCWMSAVGAVFWLALSVGTIEGSPSAEAAVSEPVPVVIPGA